MYLIMNYQFIRGTHNMTLATKAIQVDTRPMDAKQGRSAAFAAFDRLSVDASMELLSDHDPATLAAQFELEKPHLFSWEILQSGPEVWRVAVTKIKTKPGVDSCCGGCGGQTRQA